MGNVQITRHRGFSLVELLVVVAIIVVLLALLFPGVRRVKDKALQVVCQSNMRQIMASTTTFCADNDGNLPGPNWGWSGQGWLYSNGRMDSYEDMQTGQLWSYIGNIGTYRCPADGTPRPDQIFSVPNRPRNSRMITSYCSNGSWIAYGRRSLDNATGLWNTDSLSQFRGDDILYWEAWEIKAGGWWWDGSNYPHEGVTYRHGQQATVACADGRVEALYADDYYELARDRANPVTNYRNRIWNVPGPVQK